MSQQDLRTLNLALSQLKKRWGELDRYVADAGATARKMEVLDLMDLINLRLQWLEVTRNHIKAEIVQIEPQSKKDNEFLQAALGEISEELGSGDKWSAIKKQVGKSLTAARRIKMNVDGRQLPL